MEQPCRIQITAAQFPQDTAEVRALFKDYACSLPFDLSFQDFEQELADLPGAYAAPAGCCLLAREGSTPVGCVACRPLGAGICEMKRLWIDRSHRGLGIGHQLARQIIVEARTMGYTHMRLDTAPDMTAAIALYRHLGFVEIAPYRPNPIHGALFFELTL